MNNDDGLIKEKDYSESYSEKSLFEKIMRFAKKAGISVVYAVLLLYYVLQKKDIPIWAKAAIISALGYFIFPLDLIPDFSPPGYVDDFGMLISALATVAIYIDDEVKTKARTKLKDWFGDYDESSLDDVENKLNIKIEKSGSEN